LKVITKYAKVIGKNSSHANGILTVMIPKAEAVKLKQITVKSD